ncbi:hypothetical protein GCM10027429_05580 [Marivirga atlantica]|jgi:hypothetical protein|uniref:DUF4287 domain-containing protein n=1 Tax=Marivirga atlantica TaxID=1548457 RepID=A0A937A5S1_9BACT|nr:DUF4287 domain-containing protein [Marivirga atlantica]MBL0764167.1 DUF4287 domain-containing protein [Marivirga atlantica]
MEPQLQTMIDNMPEKTGKSLEQWKKILKEKAFEKHGQAVKFLKEEHGVTHGFANTIVSLSKDNDDSAEDLVESQYKGKEDLKPIYKKLIEVMSGFGKDVTITPKKTTVSIIRKRQFALIKPATKARIDLGLKLPGVETTDRLENSGPFGTMCTHRVQITDINQLDNQLIEWLKDAYEMAN